MTRRDLEAYAPMLREPAQGPCGGSDCLSTPPPSAGRVHLIEMLNFRGGSPPQDLASASPAALHLMIEAMKLAYADRAEYLGDSDAVDVPTERLTSKDYAAVLRAGINPKKARLSVDIRAGEAPASSGGNTTHVSIVDRDGNPVAMTTSLNFNYGLGLVAGQSGILLNNTLDDFAAKPGAPNAFGLTGGARHPPRPGQRPPASVTAALRLQDRAPRFLTRPPRRHRRPQSV